MMLLDLPALIQHCAPNVGPATMKALIRTESAGNPYAIGINTSHQVRLPKSKGEAVSLARSLVKAGYDFDLGLGQINVRNLPKLGLSIEQAFDPCTNIKAAATVLQWSYDRAVIRHGEGQIALLAALSAYNTGSLSRGFDNGYVARVVASAGKPIPSIQVSADMAKPPLQATVSTAFSAIEATGGAGSRPAKKLNPYLAPIAVSGF